MLQQTGCGATCLTVLLQAHTERCCSSLIPSFILLVQTCVVLAVLSEYASYFTQYTQHSAFSNQHHATVTKRSRTTLAIQPEIYRISQAKVLVDKGYEGYIANNRLAVP